MILLTGAQGLLGMNIRFLLDCYTPPKTSINITTNPYQWSFPGDVNLIIHCAAFTSLVRAEKEKELCYKTNVIGTRNLARLGIPMIYISTEYVFDGEKGNYAETDAPYPLNYYAFTKLLGEYEALKNKEKTTVIRCLFKPRPFKHAKAITDQYTSGLYVDDMAKEIVRAVHLFDRLPEIIHIGGERKSTYELARETREVEPITLEDVKDIKLPRDTSLNTTRWRSICGNSL
jgi:dTDP-4-dehydrorhamnose reductase